MVHNSFSRKRGIPMLKKILISAAVIAACSASPAMAYVFGGSNLGVFGYPKYSGYLSYDPDYNEMQRYLDDVKKYVENCNYDIQRIQEARDNAIEEASRKVNEYNMSHSMY